MKANWKDLVRQIAPALGVALGSPVGGLAVKFLADNLLDKSEASEKDIEAFVLSASPEKLIALKKLDNEFDVQMKALDIDLDSLHLQDRQNARNLFSINIWPQIILSAIFIIGYFSIMGLLVYFHAVEINDRILGILTTVIGVLTAAIPTILQFWFGSSEGSKMKTAKLANAQQ